KRSKPHDVPKPSAQVGGNNLSQEVKASGRKQDSSRRSHQSHNWLPTNIQGRRCQCGAYFLSWGLRHQAIRCRPVRGLGNSDTRGRGPESVSKPPKAQHQNLRFGLVWCRNILHILNIGFDHSASCCAKSSIGWSAVIPASPWTWLRHENPG